MKTLIEAAFHRTRTMLLLLALLLLSGSVAYVSIPKESDPDIAIPMINIAIPHEGISPEDAERLLIRPMEKELQAIEGVKEIRATASEGLGSITLEFGAGFDSDQALTDVREKVDLAKSQLPPDTDEPEVSEVNVALFPVLVIILSGDIPERLLLEVARDLEDTIEALPGVLAVDIGGDREEVLEIIVDPLVMESYRLTFDDLLRFVQRNNHLVAAGTLDSGHGRFAVKVPGVLERLEDVLNLPVKVEGDRVVRFEDIATVRRTFKDPEGFARVGGQRAVTLEVSKRIGANIIDTIAQVRARVEAAQTTWPAGLVVSYAQDQSNRIRTMLHDLQNNVLSAIVLVMVVIVAALGWRSACLVGLAIPGSFLAGILVIFSLGLTINIVVLFSLILVVGMLVDGAIVVTEFADRNMAEGRHRREAYQLAATRMAWPIIAATVTTLAVFMPLLFWPGVVGKFMQYLPITVLATLAASLVMALIFVPVLGGLIGKSGSAGAKPTRTAVSDDAMSPTGGLTGLYLRLLRRFVAHPGRVLLLASVLLVSAYGIYGVFGRGVEFFPEVDPDNAQVHIHARGDLSVVEQDALVREVEARLVGMGEVSTVYARSGNEFGPNVATDVIGIIQLEFVNWQQRRLAVEILAEVRQRTQDLAGMVLETRKQQSGPSAGKPIQIELSASDPALLGPAVARLRQGMRQIGGFVDVDDSRPLPGIEWRLQVDRAAAARHDADIALIGHAVQLVTTGIKVGEYRPDDADEELDIRVRFPFAARHLDQLDGLRVPTRYGLVPISSFVTFVAASRVGTLTRTDAHRVLTIEADVADGLLVNDQVREIRAWLPEAALDARVKVRFKGQDEDQREAQAFLVQAFAAALFLMAIILVTQFNRFYQTFLVMSAVVFSTAGVLIGLFVTGSPFGVVMGGIGVIALAGIIVNNNIVLIDTYNELRAQSLPPVEAALRTGAQRLRPVLLTTVTTILGLVPMVFGVNIDLIARDITVGAPSTQLWSQLASAIAGGLVFATPLTLLLTPCLLILGERVATVYRRRRGQANVTSTTTGGDESSREKESVTELECRGRRHLLVTLRPEPGPDTEGVP